VFSVTRVGLLLTSHANFSFECIAQSDISSRHRYFGEKCRVPYWMLFWHIRTKVESQTESVHTEL